MSYLQIKGELKGNGKLNELFADQGRTKGCCYIPYGQVHHHQHYSHKCSHLHSQRLVGSLTKLFAVEIVIL